MLNYKNFGHVMKATFLGHATVYLETNDTKILIDPFLTGNPKAAAEASDLSPEFIVLTRLRTWCQSITVPSRLWSATRKNSPV